jgi:hypothetical protein
MVIDSGTIRGSEAAGNHRQGFVGRCASILPITGQPPHIMLGQRVEPGEDLVLPIDLRADLAC